MRYAGWNMKANEATKKGPIRFAVRRARQYVFLRRLKLDVLMAVEVGSPEDCKALDAGFKRYKIPLRIVRTHGHYEGKWRYIIANPNTCTVKHAGHRRLKHMVGGDAKYAAWAVVNTHGHDRLFIAGHLAVNGPTSNKIGQARDVVSLLNEKKSAYGIPLHYCYVYMDTNDPTRKVHEYINSTGLASTFKTTPVKRRIGLKWRSNNKWKARIGKARQGFSIDELAAADDVRHSMTKSYDCHRMSDHDLVLAQTD